jgi:peptidoglycan/LPS O-acetylase OafA/YrhL
MRFIQRTKPKLLRSDIQQIRALSVIAVVLFHSFPNRFTYGYLGVDVFFFLSGFLIFPQIYDIADCVSKESLRINVKRFILRRIYRIAPALGFCILVIWVFFFFFGPSPDKLGGPEFFISILSILGIGNLAALNYSGDYFNSSSPLTHFWSLGIEMQSYFLFAIFALLFSKVIKINVIRFRFFLLMIILVSLISKYIFVFHSNIFGHFGLETLSITGNFSNFYLTPNRLWQFALGGLFATFTTKNIKFMKLNKKTSMPLFISVSILLFSNSNYFDDFRTVVIFIGIGVYLISDVGKEIKFVSRVLVWIGDRSYSIYLYHLPILFVLNTNLTPTDSKQILYMAAIVVLLLTSSFSYKHIEMTHRVPKYIESDKQKFYIKHKKLILTSYLVPTIGIASVIILNNIFPVQNSFPVNFRDNYAASDLSKCKLGQIEKPCILLDNSSNQNWLLLGDSHAGAIQGILAEIADQSDSNLIVWNKCRFFNPDLSLELNALFPKWCVDSNRKRIEYINRIKPSLIFIAYKNGPVANGDKDMPQNLWQDIFTNTLTSMNNNTSKVVLFSQIPEYKTAPYSEYRYSFSREKNLGIDQFPGLLKQRTFENKLKDEKVLIVDLVPALCDSMNCTRFLDNWLYLDTNHLSNFGADVISPTIRKFLYDNQLNS